MSATIDAEKPMRLPTSLSKWDKKKVGTVNVTLMSKRSWAVCRDRMDNKDDHDDDYYYYSIFVYFLPLY